MYFILEINRTYPVLGQGLYWTTLGITCILIMTLPQYNMGYNFPLVYPIAIIGSVLPSGISLVLLEDPLCNDSIHYTYKLCTITYPYMQCSHPHCSDHDSGLNTFRVWSTSCITRATCEAKSWISNCTVHPSSVYHVSLTSVLVSCIGFTSCIVKSRSISHLLRVDSATASASATSLSGMNLISKITQLHCKPHSHLLDGMSGKQ